MVKEIDIQHWIENFFKDPIPEFANSQPLLPKPDFFDVLDFMDDPAGQTLKFTHLTSGSGHTLHDAEYKLHRHIRDAARVLDGLIEPKLLIADEDISKINRQVLRPDLVLQDPASSAYIIIEIKRDKRTARQFGTELLAYANVLIEQYGASQVFLIQISTTWSTLEKEAFTLLAKKNFPILPLEFIEGNKREKNWRLKVRSDLIPKSNIKCFSEDSIQIVTKTFLVRPELLKSEIARNCVKHAISSLMHDANKIGTSGFLLAWHESEFMAHEKDFTIRLFVSCAVINAPGFNNHSTDILYDDTPTRLLQSFEIGLGFDSYFTEGESSWPHFIAHITDGKYYIYDFESFGEIATQVNWYRSFERYSMPEIVPDLTFLPSWHPMTWLIALDFLIERRQDNQVSELLQAYDNGRNLAALINEDGAKLRDRCSLKRAFSHVRFAQTWMKYFSDPSNDSRGSIYRTFGYLWIDTMYVNILLDNAKKIVRSQGKINYLCFLMGCNKEGDVYYAPHITELYDEVKSAGLQLPGEIENEIRNLILEMNTPSIGPPLIYDSGRKDF